MEFKNNMRFKIILEDGIEVAEGNKYTWKAEQKTILNNEV